MRTMHGRTIRSLVALVGLVAAVAGGVLSSPADAATAESASLVMTSDEGDYIGQGLQYSYSTTGNDVFSSTGNGNVVSIAVNAANGDWWYLEFAAPAGQSLAPGTYTGAIRYPFQGQGPGLSVSGNGRGCNELTGTFTVYEVTFGPNNYLQSFEASFEQHCEGFTPALRGQIQLVNPPAPDPLTIGVGVSSKGKADRFTGTATVSGTVTCSQPTTVTLSGTLTQRANRFKVAAGSLYSEVACSSTPTAWQATVVSGTGVPFNPGATKLDLTASAFDPGFGQQITVTRTAVVHLTR